MTADIKNAAQATATKPADATAAPAPSVDKAAEALRQEIEAIVRADHSAPFGILGINEDGRGGAITVRTFIPEARRIELIDAQSGEAIGDLEKIHPDGF